MNTRFSASDNYDGRIMFLRLSHQSFYADSFNGLGYEIRMPGSCGIAPGAFYGATKQSDEKCGLSHVAAFSLPGVKGFIDW
jgi:hypothetical protein